MVATGKGLASQNLLVLEAVHQILGMQSGAFTPPQVPHETICQAVQNASRKFKVDEKVLFKAVVSIVTIFLGVGGLCSVM